MLYTVFVLLELGVEGRERRTLDAIDAIDAATPAATEGKVNEKEVEERERERRKWWRDWWMKVGVNLAWAPMTVHYSEFGGGKPGVEGEGEGGTGRWLSLAPWQVAALGCVVGGFSMPGVWRETGMGMGLKKGG